MDEKVEKYIKGLGSPQREICERLRNIILGNFPGIKEEFMWGVPAYDGGRYYLGGLKDHVNLGFKIIGLSDEDIALFEGVGKTMRHIKIYSLEDIDEDRVVKLLKLVKEKAVMDSCD